MKSINQWKIFQNRNSEYARIAYFDNPHSIMDNVARVSLLVLYALTCYILLTGGIYHYEIFQTAMGKGAISIILSLGFFVVIEILKIFFGTYLLRGLLTGDAGESKIHMTTYIILFLVSVFGFWWSWNISTDAAPTLNSVIKIAEGKSRHYDSSEVKSITLDIAAIDAQIGTANASEKEGFSNRYHGVVTQNGQNIAKTAANTRNKLTDQRTALLARLNDEKDRIRTSNNAQMSAASTQLSQYGGFAEILQIVFLLLTCLCEAISYMKNKKDMEAGKIPNIAKKPGIGYQDLLKDAPQNRRQAPAEDERKPIGFKIPTPSVLAIPVITTDKTVITDEIDTISVNDKLILDALRKGVQELNSECGNYESKNGNRDTIIKRIREKHALLKQGIGDNIGLVNAHKTIGENYKKVCERAHDIVLAYLKEGGLS